MGKNKMKYVWKDALHWKVLLIVILILIPVWIWLVAPQLTKLPADFHYDAFIFSNDNFYDPATRDFSGKSISNTQFSYDVVAKENDILTIRNVFDVRKFSGETIFSVTRFYSIDAKTGRHSAGFGDKPREGYLFAPKGLKKGQDFTYWHINYDAPAYMKFKEVETILGLTVYRYEADYTADQTADLAHLPGVPEERGVELDINLQLWIEPVTGRMIKYEDNTVAYYYSQSTHERIQPWNKFSNRYNHLSIEKQVEIAKHEKLDVFFFEKAVPLLMVILALLLWFLAYRDRTRHQERL